MAPKKKSKSRRGRPPINRPAGFEPTEPVAFRLPPSLAARATQAARAVGLSRNKFVETVLRAAVENDAVKPATAEVQYDLFG
jgi:predicted HicB family RNase H-like nuclease